MVRQPPRSWETGFQDPDFNPPYWWNVTVTAMCPKCHGEMGLGSLEGGGAMLHCLSCANKEIFKDLSSDDIAKRVLHEVAKTDAEKKKDSAERFARLAKKAQEGDQK